MFEKAFAAVRKFQSKFTLKSGFGSYRLVITAPESERQQLRASIEAAFTDFRKLAERKGIGPASIARLTGHIFEFKPEWIGDNECLMHFVTDMPLDTDKLMRDWSENFEEGEVQISKFVGGELVDIVTLKPVLRTEKDEKPVLTSEVVEVSQELVVNPEKEVFTEEWASKPPEPTVLEATCDACGIRLEEVTYPYVGSIIYCKGCTLIPELCYCNKPEDSGQFGG